MSDTQLQGAMVGDNKTAQEIYENLQKGGVFAPIPGGQPPIGGQPFPTPAEIKEIPQVVTPGGLKGLSAEIRELRKEIKELREILQGL